MRYKHVLLAVNFDDDAEYLVKKAADQSRANHALFSVIHIDPDFTDLYEGVREFDLEAEGDEILSESVQAMCGLLKEADYPIYKHIFYAGYVEDQIIKAIEEFDVDLLVLGHHKSNLFRQLVLSPSEPLLRKMPCDILFLQLREL